MAVIASKYATLADVLSRMDEAGNLAPIAEVLNKNLPILKDLGFVECNMTDGYLHTVRTGLPQATWRKLYGTVMPSKSTTAQVKDTCGNLEAYTEVDKDLADLNGNTRAWRLSEEAPQIESMAQTVAETLFYGDTTKNPERFLGIAARYNTLDEKKAASARNVVNAGGTTGRLTSIYFISHDVVHGLYPKGSKAGLSHEDKGQVTVSKEGGMYEAYRSHFKWQVGLTVDDWRGCARICNVDLDSVDGAALIKHMIKAKNAIEAKYLAKTKIYLHRDVMTILENAALDKSANCLGITEAAGQFTTNFFGIPLEVCDSISAAETKVA
jgi:hypothetical protein